MISESKKLYIGETGGNNVGQWREIQKNLVQDVQYRDTSGNVSYLLLTTDGKMWNLSRDGLSPSETPDRVKMFTCASNFTVIVTESNHLYGIGSLGYAYGQDRLQERWKDNEWREIYSPNANVMSISVVNDYNVVWFVSNPNPVFIDDKWLLCDPTWDVGGANTKYFLNK